MRCTRRGSRTPSLSTRYGERVCEEEDCPRLIRCLSPAAQHACSADIAQCDCILCGFLGTVSRESTALAKPAAHFNVYTHTERDIYRDTHAYTHAQNTAQSWDACFSKLRKHASQDCTVHTHTYTHTRTHAHTIFPVQSWDAYFRNLEKGLPPAAAYTPPPDMMGSATLVSSSSALASGPLSEKEISDNLAVNSLIRAYQVRCVSCPVSRAPSHARGACGLLSCCAKF